MSDIAIRVENLSKLYRIGQTVGYKTLRESRILSPTSYLPRAMSRQPSATSYQPPAMSYELRTISHQL